MVVVATKPNNIITDEKVTPDNVASWESAFLAVLGEYCNVSKACAKAGIARSTAYDHYNTNERFKQLWDDTISSATDKLRETALKLANGEFKMKNSEGKEYGLPPNPAVLLRLLEAHDPNYRAVSRQEVTGKDGGAIETRTTNTLDGLDQASADKLIEDYLDRKLKKNQP